MKRIVSIMLALMLIPPASGRKSRGPDNQKGRTAVSSFFFVIWIPVLSLQKICEIAVTKGRRGGAVC